jgi:drug/metabolite transporter (DMT)-like permease
MSRHSPLYVTGMTMAIGGIPYIAITLPQFFSLEWSGVSLWTWSALVLSALFALNVAYLIWYVGVQRLGPARTSMYSNVVPIVAMTAAALWLREVVPAQKLIGATAVLTGVFLTRLGRKALALPPEE